MYWVGFPLAIAISLLLVPAGARGLRDAGLVRENYRGGAARLPARRGAGDGGAGRAGAARLPQRPRRPRPAGARTAAAGCPTCWASPSSASSTTRSAGARPAATPRGWRGHWAALRRGRSRPARSRRSGRWRWPPMSVSGRGLESLALPRRRRPAGPRHQPLQPARPAARAGGEGAGAARGRPLPRRLDARAARTAGDLRRAGPGRRLADPGRAGDARRHRLEPDRGGRRGLAADHARRRRAADRARGGRWR